MTGPDRLHSLKLAVFSGLSRSGWMASLYYSIRGSFRREHQALLAGKVRYLEAEARAGAVPLYRLRRDIHRIEKGLIATPRRSTFALNYIGDAVDAFIAATQAQDPDGLLADTTQWAHDVLIQYFGCVKHVPSVAAAYERFMTATAGRTDGRRTPRAKTPAPPSVPHDALLELATRRRSVRVFSDREVPRDLVDKAVDIARQSPSACNRQAWEFRLFDDPESVSEITRIAPGFDPQGRKIPCFGVVVGKYRAYLHERDAHVIYVDASLASMAFVFGLESVGLSSCCINWPSVPSKDAELGAFLGLDPDEEIIMLLAIGFADPAHLSPYSQKAPLGEVRSWNRTSPSN